MSFVKSNVPFFGPRQVPGLALWLDASDATTVSLSSNTQNVTAWRDKSGRNNNATRFGTGFPTYSSNSIVFTGTQAFSTTLPSLMSNQSGFAIVRYSSSNKINILSVNRTSGTAAIQQIIQNNVQSITTYGGSNIVTGATLTQNTMLLYNHTFSASTNAFLYINGSQTGTSTGPYNFTGAGTINIGGYDTGPGEGFVGNMNEIILYSNVLTTSQRQQVEGHLAWKWGLQANLPVSHPYRFNSQQAIYPFTIIQTPFINKHLPYYSEFSPRSIAGCALWLDAADASTVTLSNNTVAQWADKSGNSNNATQPIGSNQPAYSNSFVFLNGVNQFFNVNLDFLAGVSHNSFIVIRNFNYANIYGAANASASSNSLHIGFRDAFRYRMNFWGNDREPSFTANYRVNQTNLLNFNWVNNTSKTIYANGGFEGTSNQPGIIGTMSGGGRIGNVTNTTGSFNPAFLNANIYEMIIYTGTLTTTQRQQIEAYLASKWGLLGSLASSNPYSGNIRTLIYPNITISRPPVYSVTRNGIKWTPLQIPGCTLWLDAADVTSVTVLNGNATQWRDKSGLSNNGTATGTIAYRSAAINTYNAMSYSGATSTYFRGSNSNSTNVLTCFSVATMNSGTYGSGRILSLGLAETFDYNDTRYCAAIERGGAGINAYRAGAPLGTSALSGFSVPFLCCSLFNGTNHTMFMNGTAGTTVASTGNFAYRVYNIGNSLGEENLVWWNGFIGEVIAFNGALSTRQRQQVEGYLAYKWGLRSVLPANHPYKNIPVS